MSQYSPPKVDVNVVPNPRVINIAGDARLLAIVGTGPTFRTVVDESVTRGLGGTDYLAGYPTTNVVISKIAKRTGLVYTAGSSSNDIDAIPGLYGSLYSGSMYGSVGDGRLNWSQDPVMVATGSVPASGSVYYVSYSYSVPSTQFLPTTFSDKNDLVSFFGPENNTSGSLSVAGSLALENGAPAVICVQVSGSSTNPTAAAYRDAIDKLRKKSNIEEIVCIFPSGSLTPSTLRDDVQTYLFQHTQLMGMKGRWRGMFYGCASPYYNPTGFDTIGDSSTPASYLGKASAYGHEDVIVPAPSYVWRFDSNNNRIELDASYLACAIGGRRSAEDLRSTPITGATLVGFTIEEEKWDMFQMDSLGAGGVCVVQNVAGVNTIRDAITTDSTSADTQEQSVIGQKRNVQRTLETKLFETYTNKGKTINPSTPRDVEATIRSILNAMRTEGEIFGYGTKDDPTTGETKITAVQDPQEPRRINATCSIKYLYPLKYITVTVSTYV
jgi:hypothetical protein